MDIINIIIQIIISIILVCMLAILGYSIYNSETLSALKNFNNVKKETVIFRGISDFNSYSNVNFNTTDKTSSSYVELNPSINQNGGAEYTYNFWLYRDIGKLTTGTNKPISSDIVLLLRGNKTKVQYDSKDNCLLNDKTSQPKGYILVKNPLIRMKSDGSSIIVEYNSLSSPDVYHDSANSVCNSNWYDKNKGLLGIYDIKYDKQWFMITVVLQEVNADTDILYKNKTSCKIYINGVVMLDRIVESKYSSEYTTSAMRHNRGKLYIAPTNIIGSTLNADKIGNEKTLMIADLTYYNYALEVTDILALYNKGFTKTPALVTQIDENNYPLDKSLTLSTDNTPKPF